MKVLVYGGRAYRNRKRLFDELDKLHADEPIECVIHGDANGADRLGKAWAKWSRILDIRFPARWEDVGVPGAVVRYRSDGTAYNVIAGFQRNQQMADQLPDVAIECPGGSGTADMRKRLIKVGINPRILPD